MSHFTFDEFGRLSGESETPTERSTDVAPPPSSGGVPYWSGSSWVIVDAALPAPANGLRSDDAIAADKWEEIKAERDRRSQSGGFSVSVDGADKWFHSDLLSRTQQIGLVMMGQNIPAGLRWKTMDGSFITMTAQLAANVFAAAAAKDLATFAAAESAREEMVANPASFDVSSIVWPEIFQRGNQ